MAKSKANSANSKLLLFVIGSLIIGFVFGFFFARDRYMKRIMMISEMNMNKAVQIDDLMNQMKVLGAQDSVR